MATQTTGERVAASDDVLPYTDQALFLGLRGAGHEAVIQGLWIYRHPLDTAGLRRFNDNLARGLLGRRIETSPLPFGRHRWVQSGEHPAPDVADHPRERSELYQWADAQIALPLDPEHGPAWRLGVQPFTDGTTAVSLVVSHCIADGGAVVIALDEAVNGIVRDLGYRPAGSRSRREAVRADGLQAVRDAPSVARSLLKAARAAIRRRRQLLPSPDTGTAPDRPARVPSAAINLDAEAWDRAAARLSGNTFSLVAALATRLAVRYGRIPAADGAVALTIPLDDRQGREDTRGNVVALARVRLDPGCVGADLTRVRDEIRAGIRAARGTPDDMTELLPLVPLVPKRALGRLADVVFGFSADLPVSLSNMGDMPPDIVRADGTAAEYVSFRGMDRCVTEAALERRRGILTLMSGRIADKMVISVTSYRPGMDNSATDLRLHIAETLAEFGLVGEIV